VCLVTAAAAAPAPQTHQRLDPSFLYLPDPLQPHMLVPLVTLRQRAAAAEPADARGRAAKRACSGAPSCSDSGAGGGAWSAAALPPDHVVGGGEQGEESVARARLAAAAAAGRLLEAVAAAGSRAARAELLGLLASPSATARQFGALAAVSWAAAARERCNGGDAAAALDGGATLPNELTAQVRSPALPITAQLHSIPAPRLARCKVSLPLKRLCPPACRLRVRCPQLHAGLAMPGPCPLAPASAEPYAELVPHYSAMRREVLALNLAAREVGLCCHSRSFHVSIHVPVMFGWHPRLGSRSDGSPAGLWA
jgi:hypothetical protein